MYFMFLATKNKHMLKIIFLAKTHAISTFQNTPKFWIWNIISDFIPNLRCCSYFIMCPIGNVMHHVLPPLFLYYDNLAKANMHASRSLEMWKYRKSFLKSLIINHYQNFGCFEKQKLSRFFLEATQQRLVTFSCMKTPMSVKFQVVSSKFSFENVQIFIFLTSENREIPNIGKWVIYILFIEWLTFLKPSCSGFGLKTPIPQYFENPARGQWLVLWSMALSGLSILQPSSNISESAIGKS